MGRESSLLRYWKKPNSKSTANRSTAKGEVYLLAKRRAYLIATGLDFFKPVLADERGELLAGLRGERDARRPSPVGRAASATIWQAELVPAETRGLNVLERPFARTVVARRLDVGADPERANAGLAAPVVARRVVGRPQMDDAVGCEERLDLGVDEMTAVVGLDDEGRAVLGEERPESVDRRSGRVFGCRKRKEELPEARSRTARIVR